MCRNISAISSSSFSLNASRSPCGHKSSIRAKEREKEKKKIFTPPAEYLLSFVCFSLKEKIRAIMN